MTLVFVIMFNTVSGGHSKMITLLCLYLACICALMVESLEAIASILLLYLLVLCVSSMYFPVFVVRSHVASQMKITALSFLTRFDFNAFHIKLVSYIQRFDSEIIKRSIYFSVDTCQFSLFHHQGKC